MRRERQLCMTSMDFFDEECIHNDDEMSTNHNIDTRTINFFIHICPLIHQSIYEQNKKNACFFTNYDSEIIYCNDIWYNLFKYMECEVMHKNPSLLQGPLTNKQICKTFTKKLYENDVSKMQNINYDKYGKTHSIIVSSRRINFNNDISSHIPYFFTSIKEVLKM